jgi:N-acetyl-anhydromuramyl-L-alanine amidase AmpD
MPPRRTALLICLFAYLSCTSHNSQSGRPEPRRGDEIIVCGQFFHTGAPVITWLDSGGYNAYATQPLGRNNAAETEGPRRYNQREGRAGESLAMLRDGVDQFVLHFDACGTSRQCFHVLQDVRGLSVHFMLDLDGTIYQTLDLKERAWHATSSNDRSIGIEIANIGCYGDNEKSPLADWYRKDPAGHTRLLIPVALGAGKFLRTSDFIGHPIRDARIDGQVQGRTMRMYDYTPQQYDSLIKLTAALCTVFPKIRCDCPRGGDGQFVPRKLPDAQLAAYRGVLGHYHIQLDKTDPGPAMQWDLVIDGARGLMKRPK